MKITVKEVRADCLYLQYPRPGFSNDEDHQHVIPFDAIRHRMALYDINELDAIEEIIHEHWSPTRDPEKWATKADRDASRAANGRVIGHRALKLGLKAHDKNEVEEHMKRIIGQDHLNKIKGK